MNTGRAEQRATCNQSTNNVSYLEVDMILRRLPVTTVTTSDGRFDGLHLWFGDQPAAFRCPRSLERRRHPRHRRPRLGLGNPDRADRHELRLPRPTPAHPGRSACEFGVYGHGPDAKDLIDQVIQHIRSWDGSSLGARIKVFPADL